MSTTTVRRGLAAAAAATLLSSGVIAGIASIATAGDVTTDVPCATEQAQVDKATAKLEALQAVFAKDKQELKKAEKALEKADTAKDKKQAKADVVDAKDAVAKADKDKKAQAQRLTHAQAKLDACLASVPTDTPTDVESSTTAG
jgi:septal ring factor EnvC (AmiA/AmiB activator)